jgi:hypothetical protein
MLPRYGLCFNRLDPRFQVLPVQLLLRADTMHAAVGFATIGL